MSRCEFKGCVYQTTTPTEKFCIQHRSQAASIKRARPSNDEGAPEIVSISEVPSTARFNQAAANLLKAVKALTLDHALKISLSKISKPTVTCTQRYALLEKLRIGIRFSGDVAFLWKLTEEQLKAVEKKAARMAEIRSKRGTPKKSAATK
jgi:hypothetical protein